MPHFTFTQPIRQLDKRRGSYFYFQIDAEVVEQFNKKRATRLVCVVDEKLRFSCGLNHLSDGNFFIILAGRHLKSLGKKLGDMVVFGIFEDPNPLGVEVPEVLQVLLEQDEAAKSTCEQLTDGKKRSLIFSIKNIKDVDLQVRKIEDFLKQQSINLKQP